jgi:tetratricopeptide (TPR) repeat protein
MQLGDMAASAEERERGLRDFWKKTYAFVDVRTTGAGYDPDRREYRIEAKGDARLDWEDKAYWLTDTGLGDAEVSFERDAREDQNAPFAVTYPYFWRTTQTILLPPGIEPDDADVDETAGGIHYRRKASFVDNVYTMESSTRSIAPDFPAREAPAAQKTIRALATRHVALRIGPDHEQSPAEIEAVLARTAETAEELNEQGKLLFDLARYEMALARFDQAAKLEPDNAIVLARRGVTRLRLGDYAAADRDFAAAEAIDSDSLTLAWRRSRRPGTMPASAAGRMRCACTAARSTWKRPSIHYWIVPIFARGTMLSAAWTMWQRRSASSRTMPRHCRRKSICSAATATWPEWPPPCPPR